MRGSVFAVAMLFSVAFAPCYAGEDQSAKEAIVEHIMTLAEQRAGKEWDARAKESLKQGLMARSFAELSEATKRDRALEILMGGKTLGSALNDWVFTPVPSCRILDTRPGSGVQGEGDGPLIPGNPYSFDVAGGFAAACLIAEGDAKAVSINFIAVSAAGNGNLRSWPWDNTEPPQPGTAVITYTAGFNTSNGVVVPICNTATATGGDCNEDLFVQTNNSSAHVVADVFGYFAAPLATAADCTTTSTSSTVVIAQTFSLSSGTCPAGRTVTGGGCASSSILYWSQMSPDVTAGVATQWLCSGYNNSGIPVQVARYAVCCRVPGR